MNNYYCPPMDCNKVLTRYHNMVKEAQKLYEKSDNIIDKEAISAILHALKALEYAMELNKKADCMVDNANEMLEKSGCASSCNLNNPQCQALYNKAMEQFTIENQALIDTMELLNEALAALKVSVEARNKGQMFLSKYFKCIHQQKPQPPCPPPTCPPPCPPPCHNPYQGNYYK